MIASLTFAHLLDLRDLQTGLRVNLGYDLLEVKYDDENYSKAFKQYRKEWVEDHIVWIIVGILVLFLVPMGIGKIRALKHEIDTDEYFQMQEKKL